MKRDIERRFGEQIFGKWEVLRSDADDLYPDGSPEITTRAIDSATVGNLSHKSDGEVLAQCD